jgi:hypothetical protein
MWRKEEETTEQGISGQQLTNMSADAVLFLKCKHIAWKSKKPKTPVGGAPDSKSGCTEFKSLLADGLYTLYTSIYKC